MNGVRIAQGTTYDFNEYSDLQSTVMPVVSLQERHLRCWGTAACIGPGWFLTARHVIEGFVEVYGEQDDGSTGLFILWETDQRLTGPNNYLGAPLPVTHVHQHSIADLATLSASLPAQASEHLRVAPLALRMPDVGEPLAVVGYSHMSLTGEVSRTDMSTLDYSRTLTVAVGAVLEQQPERRGRFLRGSPGIVTDAPILPGMSGGPVFDRNRAIIGFASSSMDPVTEGGSWNSYVALWAPALELNLYAREFDDSPPTETSLAYLVSENAILCEMYDSFDIDPVTRLALYRRSDAARGDAGRQS